MQWGGDSHTSQPCVYLHYCTNSERFPRGAGPRHRLPRGASACAAPLAAGGRARSLPWPAALQRFPGGRGRAPPLLRAPAPSAPAHGSAESQRVALPSGPATCPRRASGPREGDSPRLASPLRASRGLRPPCALPAPSAPPGPGSLDQWGGPAAQRVSGRRSPPPRWRCCGGWSAELEARRERRVPARGRRVHPTRLPGSRGLPRWPPALLGATGRPSWDGSCPRPAPSGRRAPGPRLQSRPRCPCRLPSPSPLEDDLGPLESSGGWGSPGGVRRKARLRSPRVRCRPRHDPPRPPGSSCGSEPGGAPALPEPREAPAGQRRGGGSRKEGAGRGGSAAGTGERKRTGLEPAHPRGQWRGIGRGWVRARVSRVLPERLKSRVRGR